MTKHSKHRKGDLAPVKLLAVDESMTPSDAKDVKLVTISRNRHWTAAEKLEAVEKARNLCYVDIKTASMEHVPSTTIRSYLYIPSKLLESWSVIEDQIKQWPPTTRRRPPRNEITKNPAKTDVASHLSMALAELKKKRIITTAVHDVCSIIS